MDQTKSDPMACGGGRSTTQTCSNVCAEFEFSATLFANDFRPSKYRNKQTKEREKACDATTPSTTQTRCADTIASDGWIGSACTRVDIHFICGNHNVVAYEWTALEHQHHNFRSTMRYSAAGPSAHDYNSLLKLCGVFWYFGYIQSRSRPSQSKPTVSIVHWIEFSERHTYTYMP